MFSVTSHWQSHQPGFCGAGVNMNAFMIMWLDGTLHPAATEERLVRIYIPFPLFFMAFLTIILQQIFLCESFFAFNPLQIVSKPGEIIYSCYDPLTFKAVWLLCWLLSTFIRLWSLLKIPLSQESEILGSRSLLGERQLVGFPSWGCMSLLSELSFPIITGFLCPQALWSKSMLVRLHGRVNAVSCFWIRKVTGVKVVVIVQS